LVAPLDWGLGHATRCIPLINEILSQGHQVMIAADGGAYNLLKEEFPGIPIIRLKGYHPVYPENGNMVLAMALQVPKFLSAILLEHFRLKTIIQKYSIDAVVSDNRYGLWSKKISCVLITHQLFIKMPGSMKWLEAAVNRLNHFFISRFSQCWVPDKAGEENLSGELSHGNILPRNVGYIGLLTRLQHPKTEDKKYEILALISGPEPQRTIFEEEIKRQLTGLQMRALIVRGVTESCKKEMLHEFVEMISHLTTKELSVAMEQSTFVVCRAGYSSLMELISLRKKALIVPTPGQTEQEYLAERCRKLNYFAVQKQSEINLWKALQEVEKTNPPAGGCNHELQSAVQELLANI